MDLEAVSAVRTYNQSFLTGWAEPSDLSMFSRGVSDYHAVSDHRNLAAYRFNSPSLIVLGRERMTGYRFVDRTTDWAVVGWAVRRA